MAAERCRQALSDSRPRRTISSICGAIEWSAFSRSIRPAETRKKGESPTLIQRTSSPRTWAATSVAPITNIDLPEVNGEMHIKPGYMAAGDHICVKIATCYYDNPANGLPTRDGLIVLANRRNGRIEAVLCDGGLITAAPRG